MPKSVTPSRKEPNLRARGLSGYVLEALNGSEANKRFNWQSTWGYDIFGQLGDDEVKRIAREARKEKLEWFGA